MTRFFMMIAVVASLIGSATAAIDSGGYLGIHTGFGFARTKITYDPSVPGSTELGNDAGNYGFLAGFGKIFGSLYFAGELFYTFEVLKIRSDVNAMPEPYIEITRKKYYGGALRAGVVFRRNTLFYFRLGGHGGTWKLTDNSVNGGVGTTVATKNRLTLAPGLGLETAVLRNLYLRGEWFYEFGPTIVATNSLNQGLYSRARNVLYNSSRLGLTYKF